MSYTISLSPLLVTKKGFMLKNFLFISSHNDNCEKLMFYLASPFLCRIQSNVLGRRKKKELQPTLR